MLRSKYLNSLKGRDYTFKSVILAGVYNIKNLKLKLRPEAEIKYNSPWNIASDFNIDMSFSSKDIATMLTEYESDCQTGMDINAVSDVIFENTSGYPYLVSRLCQIIQDNEYEWNSEGVIQADGTCSDAPADINEIYNRIWKGSLPGIASGKYTDRDVFYNSYLQTYIERDVSELLDKVDKIVFSDFIRAAACRIGQVLNVHDIALDVGVSDETAKRWLSVLERSDIIFYLRPYSNNLLKRTIKSPKMYFFDTGLVAYLTRYSTPEILANGALNGAILENYVVSEIRNSYHNIAKECLIWYYRDKDSREIDMVTESDGELHPLEIKRSVNPPAGLTNAFAVLDKGSVPRGKGALICMRSELSAIDSDNFIVPVWMI